MATAASLALARLAQRYGVTQRVMLERLIRAADDKITGKLGPDSPAWDAYLSVTQ